MVLLDIQENVEGMRNIEATGSAVYRQQQKDRFIFGVTQFVTEAHQSFHNLLTSYSQLKCDHQDNFQILHDQQTVDVVEEFFGAFAILLQHFEHSKEVLYHSDEQSTEVIHHTSGKENLVPSSGHSRTHNSNSRRFSLPSVKEDIDILLTSSSIKHSTMNEITNSILQQQQQQAKHSSTDSDSSHHSTRGEQRDLEIKTTSAVTPDNRPRKAGMASENVSRNATAEVSAREAALRCSRSPVPVAKHLVKVKSKLDDEKSRSAITTKRRITEHKEPLYFEVVKETIREYEQHLNLEEMNLENDSTPNTAGDAQQPKVNKTKPAEEQKIEFLNILQQKLQEQVPEKTETFDDMKLSRQKKMSITEPVYAEVIRKTLEQFGRRKLEHRKSISEHRPCKSPNLLNMFEENLTKNHMIEEDKDDPMEMEEDTNTVETSVPLKNEDPVYAIVLKHALKQRRLSRQHKMTFQTKIKEEDEEECVDKNRASNNKNGHTLSPIMSKKVSSHNHSRSSSDISLASEEVSEINRKTFVSASPHRLHQHGDHGGRQPALPVIPSPDYSVPDEAKRHPHHVSRPFWNNDLPPPPVAEQTSAFANTNKYEDSHGENSLKSNEGGTTTARRSNSSSSSKRKVSNSSFVNDVIEEEEDIQVSKSPNGDSYMKTTDQNTNPGIVTVTLDAIDTNYPEDHHNTQSPQPPQSPVAAPPQIDRSKKPSKKMKDRQSPTNQNKTSSPQSPRDTSTLVHNHSHSDLPTHGTPSQISVTARGSAPPLIPSTQENIMNNENSQLHSTQNYSPSQLPPVSPTQQLDVSNGNTEKSSSQFTRDSSPLQAPKSPTQRADGLRESENTASFSAKLGSATSHGHVSPTTQYLEKPAKSGSDVINKKVTVVPPPDYSPLSSPELSPKLSAAVGGNRRIFHTPSPVLVEKRLIEVLDDGENDGEATTDHGEITISSSPSHYGEIPARSSVDYGEVGHRSNSSPREVSGPPPLDRSKKPTKRMLSPSEMKAFAV